MKTKKTTIFDFLNDISFNKKNILSEENEKEYNIFMVNKFLSMNYDTIAFSSIMNSLSHVSKRDHYNFMLNGIPKKKRFFKYMKNKKFDDIKYLVKYYGVSENKALEYMKLLNKEQIDKIKQKFININV